MTIQLFNYQISCITQDSRNVVPGCIFFAIEGTQDGHLYIQKALDAGAQAVVIRKGHPLEKKFSTPNIIAVESPKKLFGETASEIFGNPSKHLKIIGVTGTNGKTTSTYLIESLLSQAAIPCGVMGTIENRYKNFIIPSTHTTPEAISLQKLFADFKSKGAQALAIEVSSHALEQYRTWGTHFESVLFTNLTQDHLDYHSTMDNYFNSKLKLFTDYPVKNRIIHVQSDWGERIKKICIEKKLPHMTTGPSHCNFNYGNMRSSASGITGSLHIQTEQAEHQINIESPLLGQFNIENLTGAIAAAFSVGILPEVIEKGVRNTKPIPGRLEPVLNSKNLTIIVDYAHTPDALQVALITLRQLLLPGQKLICLFGCGGDRDNSKRLLMGSIAEKYSDQVFITSDNPRTENPIKILQDIQKGFENPHNATIIEDRRTAIQNALSMLQPNDILLIAGKGHESYQIIGKTKHPFDDRLVVQELLK